MCVLVSNRGLVSKSQAELSWAKGFDSFLNFFHHIKFWSLFSSFNWNLKNSWTLLFTKQRATLSTMGFYIGCFSKILSQRIWFLSKDMISREQNKKQVDYQEPDKEKQEFINLCFLRAAQVLLEMAITLKLSVSGFFSIIFFITSAKSCKFNTTQRYTSNIYFQELLHISKTQNIASSKNLSMYCKKI